MIHWGISANSHNAALSVFENNDIKFASESERFSGIKNDPDLNTALIDYALQWGEPDLVSWYESPWLKSARQIFAGQGILDNRVSTYLNRYNITAPIKYARHHYSHACAGYYTSTFTDACVIVIDAIGEFETLTIWQATGSDLKKVYSLSYPNSVGLWYSAMTQRCGLKPNEEEYILMGMAALGNPDRLTDIILNDFVSLDDFKNPVKFKSNLHRGCKQWRLDLSSTQDVYDIAAATQKVYEIIFDKILNFALPLAHSNNLVLMGGCALNCVANKIAYRYFNNMWIMPAPGDSGSSIGVVLAYTKKHTNWTDSFLGYDMGSKDTNTDIVKYLLSKQICGIARGRAEFGPRALGNRSLIADPRGQSIKDRVNEIKHRQQFRPFAPAILSEMASDYFDIPAGANSDFMQMTYLCKYPYKFPAIVHTDMTSRLQTVPNNGSPFRKLLEEWYAKTNCPILLNTSLNIKGEPIVNDAEDANNWSKKYNVKVFS